MVSRKPKASTLRRQDEDLTAVKQDISMGPDWFADVRKGHVKALPRPGLHESTGDKALDNEMHNYDLDPKAASSKLGKLSFGHIRYFRVWRGYNQAGPIIPASKATRKALDFTVAGQVIEVCHKDGRSYFVTGPGSAQWHVPALLLPPHVSADPSHREYWYNEVAMTLSHEKHKMWLNVATNTSTHTNPFLVSAAGTTIDSSNNSLAPASTATEDGLASAVRIAAEAVTASAICLLPQRMLQELIQRPFLLMRMRARIGSNSLASVAQHLAPAEQSSSNDERNAVVRNRALQRLSESIDEDIVEGSENEVSIVPIGFPRPPELHEPLCAGFGLTITASTFEIVYTRKHFSVDDADDQFYPDSASDLEESIESLLEGEVLEVGLLTGPAYWVTGGNVKSAQWHKPMHIVPRGKKGKIAKWREYWIGEDTHGPIQVWLHPELAMLRDQKPDSMITAAEKAASYDTSEGKSRGRKNAEAQMRKHENKRIQAEDKSGSTNEANQNMPRIEADHLKMRLHEGQTNGSIPLELTEKNIDEYHDAMEVIRYRIDPKLHPVANQLIYFLRLDSLFAMDPHYDQHRFHYVRIGIKLLESKETVTDIERLYILAAHERAHSAHQFEHQKQFMAALLKARLSQWPKYMIKGQRRAFCILEKRVKEDLLKRSSIADLPRADSSRGGVNVLFPGSDSPAWRPFELALARGENIIIRASLKLSDDDFKVFSSSFGSVPETKNDSMEGFLDQQTISTTSKSPRQMQLQMLEEHDAKSKSPKGTAGHLSGKPTSAIEQLASKEDANVALGLEEVMNQLHLRDDLPEHAQHVYHALKTLIDEIPG